MESKLKKLAIVTSVNVNEKETGHPADPKSPVVPVQVENIAVGNLTENDDEKIILTLESLHYSTEATESAKKMEENQRALEKLDKLLQANSITRRKIVKTENGDKSSGISFVTIRNLANDKKVPRILNSTLGKSEKRLLNNIGKPIPSEEDLLAILEGNNHDDESEIKVIEDTSNKTVTTVLLSKNQELKIAADQIKEIARKPMISKTKDLANTTIASNEDVIVSNTNELINSIASDWSDNERENLEEQLELKIKVRKGKQLIEKVKSEPKIMVSKDVAPIEAITEIEKVNDEINEIKSEKVDQQTGIAPYKRSRVIKKKIIWDPDAPETQFSYASLIKPKSIQPANKKVQKKAAIINALTPENEASEKPKPVTNVRKRKEPTPDKVQENIQEALNEILSEEIDLVLGENSEKTELAIKAKEIKGAKKPRLTKTKQAASSTSWNYINKGQSDEMMIIRRRSSSYSSTTSQRRMSLEQQQQQQSRTPQQKTVKVARKIAASRTLKTPPIKKKQEIKLKKVKEIKQPAEMEENTAKLRVLKKLSVADTKKLAPPSPIRHITLPVNKKSNKPTLTSNIEKTVVSLANSPPSTNLKTQKILEKKAIKVLEEDPKADIEIILKKLDSVVNFILDIKTDNPSNTFSIDFIKKFISTLEHLKNDDSCKIVVVSSKGTHFCHGIDYSCLIAPTIEKRKIIATELAKYIKLLFETLINFNKPIMAAVGGMVSNLGITMLPLFDFVFASDKCAFEMTYSKIGQIPEGNCILSIINMDKKYKLKLIYLAEKLTANEALSSGLLTAVYPTQRFELEAINVATKMASFSQQTYKSMKQLRVQKFATEGFVKALEEEQNLLIEHWISAECQEKFKQLLKK